MEECGVTDTSAGLSYELEFFESTYIISEKGVWKREKVRGKGINKRGEEFAGLKVVQVIYSGEVLHSYLSERCESLKKLYEIPSDISQKYLFFWARESSQDRDV